LKKQPCIILYEEKLMYKNRKDEANMPSGKSRTVSILV
jgi:hypothetical protein